MEPVKILCICGSGVAGANIIMYKLKVAFEKSGIPLQLVTGGVSQMAMFISTGQADMIVSTSMMKSYEGIPYFQAIPFYTGEGEKELLDEIVAAARKIQEERTDQEEEE